MNLYLDEDMASALLAQVLRRAGHDVQLPGDVGLSGKTDPEVFRHTIVADRVLLSRNFRDFELLHRLVLASGGHHPGILVERFDNNPNHKLLPGDIVRALRNVEAAGFVMTDEYQILNLWQ
jgi:predicted nuclease of predicted toxin-antitoxin system